MSKEPGDKCPNCDGILELVPQGDCSCHISPPCHNCVEAVLICSECGEEYE